MYQPFFAFYPFLTHILKITRRLQQVENNVAVRKHFCWHHQVSRGNRGDAGTSLSSPFLTASALKRWRLTIAPVGAAMPKASLGRRKRSLVVWNSETLVPENLYNAADGAGFGRTKKVR